MGDFNAKLGKKIDDTEDKLGEYGFGLMNDRGERLLQYLKQQRLHTVKKLIEQRKTRKISSASEPKALMELKKKLFNEVKSGIIEYVKLNETIRKIIEEVLWKHQEEEIEKVLGRNKRLKCLRLSHGKLVIITLRNKQGDEDKHLKKITQLVKEVYEDQDNSEIQSHNDTQESLRER
ncbi:hypothetical protein HHI36_015633 [Cryptolaemus montrouzieri]|uniref:Uncharacterized protein n=1 Tax=Cryptolaemus montrouzieri TaxID=559131 RepID=A0ABD2N6L8_9CUCU